MKEPMVSKKGVTAYWKKKNNLKWGYFRGGGELFCGKEAVSHSCFIKRNLTHSPGGAYGSGELCKRGNGWILRKS